MVRAQPLMPVTDDNIRMDFIKMQSENRDNFPKRIEIPRPLSSARTRPAQSQDRHLGHQRPRSISAGRINDHRSLDQDFQATSVTKAIVELRDKREKSRSRRRNLKQQTFHQSRSNSFSDDRSHQSHQSQDTSPHKIKKRNRCARETVELSSSLHEGEKAATFKLKEAEDKIGSLMQDLEELRFFHEIAMEPSSKPLPTKLVAGVPRGSSPASPSQRFLSPRRLSSMDRNSLELETQELQRKVEILQQEKHDLNATVESLEQQTKSHSEDKKRMSSLEISLIDIRNTIIEEMKKMHQGRIELTEEFNLTLETANKENAQMRKEADTKTTELDLSRKNIEILREEYSRFREKTKKKNEDLQRKWGEKKHDYEAQLDEITNVLDETQQTLASRDEDVERLQNDLIKCKLEEDNCKKKLAVSLSSKSELEECLQKQKNQYEQLEEQHKETSSVLDFKTQRINTLEERLEQQSEKMEKMQKTLDIIDDEHKQSLEELKHSFDSQQQRRLDDLVESQHAKIVDYEERLTDLRKQLNLATQRYHTEIEQKNAEMKQQQDEIVQDAKNKIMSEYETKVAAQQQSLDSLHQQCDDSRAEALKLQALLELKDKKFKQQIEQQDSMQKEEIENLQDELRSSLRQIGEREAKIKSLSDRLSQSEDRCTLLLEEMETQQTDESRTREDLILQRKSVSKLRSEISRKEFQIEELKHKMETEVENLKGEIEEVQRRGSLSESDAKARLERLQLSLEGAQRELAAEKSRNESQESEFRVEIAKVNGKLFAAEATVKEKRTLIESLEKKLSSTSKDSSCDACIKLHATVTELRDELDNYKENIQEEKFINQEKDAEIRKLQNDLKASNEASDTQITNLEEKLTLSQKLIDQLKKDLDSKSVVDLNGNDAVLQGQIAGNTEINCSNIGDLEKLLASSQCRIDELETALRHSEGKVTELGRAFDFTQKDLKELEQENAKAQDELVSLRSVEKRLCTEIEELSAEREEASMEAKNQIDSYRSKLENMEIKLKEKEADLIETGLKVEELKTSSKQESNDLKTEVKKLKLVLQTVTKEDSAPTEDIVHLQNLIKDLEDEVESLRCSRPEMCNSNANFEHLERKLEEKEGEQTELEKALRKALHERAQAMEGLERMIEEVQIRQDEFDALSDILEKRDEELESAKMIATKALASAQEIKARYKGKGARDSGRRTELHLEIDELTASIEYLTEKNDKLRSKSKKLEMELHEKNKECAKLRDGVRESETKSTQSSSFNSSIKPDKDGFMPFGKFQQDEPDVMMKDNAFYLSDEQSNSSSCNPVALSSFKKTEEIGNATRWLQDFEDVKSAFSNESSTTNENREENSRSAARDSGRKRNRKRYAKLKY